MFDVAAVIDQPLFSTRINSVVVALALCVLAQLAGAPAADACTCLSSGPACQAFWTTDVAFDGTVVKIDPTSRDETFSDRTFQVTEFVVTLQVRQSWKGVEGETVQVTTSGSGASCGFNFKMGGRYLVFASRGGSDSRPRVSLCSFTRAYDGTGETAAFFTSLDAPEAGARVFGSTQLMQRSFTSGSSHDRSPMDLEVRLTGNGRTLTTTAKAGRYEFSGLAAGHYGLSVIVPEGYSTWMPTRPVEIPNQRACFESDFSLAPSGRISGWLVDARGRGVPNVVVEATGAEIALDRQKYLEVVSARSDDSGFFELRDLPPGRYIAGINLQDSSQPVSAVRPDHLSWRQRATDDAGGRARSERGSWALGASTSAGGDQVDRSDYLEGRHAGRGRVCRLVGHRSERGVARARCRRSNVRNGRTLRRRRTGGSRLSVHSPPRWNRTTPEDLCAADRCPCGRRSDRNRDPPRSAAVTEIRHGQHGAHCFFSHG